MVSISLWGPAANARESAGAMSCSDRAPARHQCRLAARGRGAKPDRRARPALPKPFTNVECHAQDQPRRRQPLGEGPRLRPLAQIQHVDHRFQGSPSFRCGLTRLRLLERRRRHPKDQPVRCCVLPPIRADRNRDWDENVIQAPTRREPMTERKTVSPAELNAWLTREIRKIEGCHKCELTWKYRLRALGNMTVATGRS